MTTPRQTVVRRRTRRTLATLAVLAVVPAALHGQDNQYWFTAYGTRAQLLGGIVIGSQVDISAVYYNPGALVFGAAKALAIAGSAYQYSSVTYKGGAEGGKDLTSSSISGVPSLFAGQLSNPTSKNRFAYSVLSRNSVDTRVTGHGIPLDTLFGTSGLSYATADIQLEENLSEYWGGMSYARQLNDHIGVGISPYFAVRSQRGRFEEQAQALSNDGAGGVAIRDNTFDYTNWRILAIIGVSVQYPRWSAGLTFTTPSARLFGSGAVNRNQKLIDQGIEGGGPRVPYIAVDFQQDLQAHYSSPAAVGFGGSYTFGDNATPTTIHFAGQWYGSVDSSVVLAPAPFTPQTGGAQLTGVIFQRLASVFNAGVGLEHRFSQKLAAYGSYRTDKAPSPGPVSNTAISRWNLSHITGGASFTIGKSEFTVGADYGFGSRTQTNDVTIGPDNTPILPAGAEISAKAITFIIGYQYTTNQ